MTQTAEDKILEVIKEKVDKSSPKELQGALDFIEEQEKKQTAEEYLKAEMEKHSGTHSIGLITAIRIGQEALSLKEQETEARIKGIIEGLKFKHRWNSNDTNVVELLDYNELASKINNSQQEKEDAQARCKSSMSSARYPAGTHNKEGDKE